jgi:hypothetical protein
MKPFILTFILIVTSLIYTKGQDSTYSHRSSPKTIHTGPIAKGQDSTLIINEYKTNIKTGRVIKIVGFGLMTAGALTTFLTFPFVAADPLQVTDAGTVMEVALITTLVAIPIAIIGRHMQKSNERKLAIYCRLGLQTNMNTPTIGIKYRF